jgi:hypothetical protein
MDVDDDELASYSNQFLADAYDDNDPILNTIIDLVSNLAPEIYEQDFEEIPTKFNSPDKTDTIQDKTDNDQSLNGVDIESTFKYNSYDHRVYIESILKQLNNKREGIYDIVSESKKVQNLTSIYMPIESFLPDNGISNYIQLCPFFPQKFLRYIILKKEFDTKVLTDAIKEYYNVITLIGDYYILLVRNPTTNVISIDALNLTQSTHADSNVKDIMIKLGNEFKIKIPEIKPIDNSHYIYFTSFIQTLQQNISFKYIIQYLLVLSFIIMPYSMIERTGFVINFLLYMINKKPIKEQVSDSNEILKKLKLPENSYYRNEGIDNINKDYIYPNKQKMTVFINDLFKDFLSLSTPYWFYLFDLDYPRIMGQPNIQHKIRLARPTTINNKSLPFEFDAGSIFNTLLMKGNNKKDDSEFKRIIDDISKQLKTLDIDPAIQTRERLVQDVWFEPIYRAKVLNLRHRASAKSFNINQKDIPKRQTEVIILEKEEEEAVEKGMEIEIPGEEDIQWGLTSSMLIEKPKSQKKIPSEDNNIIKFQENQIIINSQKDEKPIQQEEEKKKGESLSPIPIDKFKIGAIQVEFINITDKLLSRYKQQIKDVFKIKDNEKLSLSSYNINNIELNISLYYSYQPDPDTGKYNSECGFFILFKPGSRLKQIYYNNITLNDTRSNLVFFVKVYSLSQPNIDVIKQTEMINDLLISYYLRIVPNRNFLNIVDWYICNFKNANMVGVFSPGPTLGKETIYINQSNINGNFQFKVYEKKSKTSACTSDLISPLTFDTFLYQLFSILIGLEIAYSKTGFIHNNLYIRYNEYADNVTLKLIDDINDRDLCFKREGGKLYRFNVKQHNNIIVKISNFEKSRITLESGDIINNKVSDKPFIDQKTLLGSILQNLNFKDTNKMIKTEENTKRWEQFLDFCRQVLGINKWQELLMNDPDITEDSIKYNPLLEGLSIPTLNLIDLDNLVGLNYYIKKKITRIECQKLIDQILFRPMTQHIQFYNYGLSLKECLDHSIFDKFKSEISNLKDNDIIISDV